MTDDDLYERGMRTAAACWEVLARGSSGVEIHGLPHVSVAVFPDEPERSIYNNAILGRGLAPAERAAALDAMEALYTAAGISLFAAWVHETDRGMRDELTRRGYAVDTTTRAMGMPLDDVSLPRPRIELAPPTWREHLRLIGVSSALLRDLDPAALHLLVAQCGGESVATAFGFDHDGDCGIYNLGTLPQWRRRGFGTVVTSTLVHEAVARGCRSASLQSTPTAERMYAALGFRDLGRIIEYVPTRRRVGARGGRHATGRVSITRP
jgi:ribosomal protein S18 acetylase RimI-like enzyme